MAISIRHAFQLTAGDGTDATVVRPSNWNANHAFTVGANCLVGNPTNTAGANAGEVAMGLLGQQILAAGVINDLAGTGMGVATTGSIMPTLLTGSPPPGWIFAAQGTIGNVGSSASIRANPDTLALYTLIWGTISQANAPVTGGKGSSALADFGALKALQIPGMIGRVLLAAGSASGITPKSVGDFGGAETHTLVTAEMPVHSHGGQTTAMNGNQTHTHGYDAGGAAFQKGIVSDGAGRTVLQAPGEFGGGGLWAGPNISAVNIDHVHFINAEGSGAAHNNMQPWAAVNYLIKL